MLERNNPHLDVDRLVLKVQDAVARREIEGNLEPIAFEAPRPDVERTIRILLATAEKKSETRASWPSRLDFFPFTNQRVQSVFLRALAFVFKDQRHVNLSLVEAMRGLLVANEDLRARIEVLEGGNAVAAHAHAQSPAPALFGLEVAGRHDDAPATSEWQPVADIEMIVKAPSEAKTHE